MKKILFVNDIAYGGGTEMVLRQITANLPRDRYSITVLTFVNDDNFYQYYGDDIKYMYLYKKDMMSSDTFAGKCINRIKRDRRDHVIKKMIQKEGFDVAVSIKEGSAMKYVSKLKVPRKVAWIHTDYSVLHWSAGCFESDEEELACMKTFDKVVCVSNTVMNNVIKYVGDSGNMCVLENPIDEKDIMAKSHESQNIVSRTPGKVLFVTVGRLCQEKGYDMLIEACHRLNRQGLEDMYEVWIIGGGECESELKTQLAQENVSNVRMLGRQDNPYKFMKEADWFISTSRAEGYAIAPQEAAVLGIPVIATDCSGVRELLGDGEYGIIIGIDVDSIEEHMKQVILEPDKEEYYRSKIIEISGDITIDTRINKIIEIL
ncbi:MAG: glycosyltransferase [Bacteroides sp.]